MPGEFEDLCVVVAFVNAPGDEVGAFRTDLVGELVDLGGRGIVDNMLQLQFVGLLLTERLEGPDVPIG